MSAPSSLPLLFVSPFPSTSFVRIYLFRTHRTQNTSCLPYAKILLYLCPKWICFIMAYTRIITIFLQRFKASSLLCQGVPLTFSCCRGELHTAAAFVQLAPSYKNDAIVLYQHMSAVLFKLPSFRQTISISLLNRA